MLFRRFRKKKDEIRTRKLTIEDAAGKARITAEVDHEDNACVCFYDEAGRDKLVLSLSTDGTPRVGLRYADNHGLILIEANESQKTPSIVITGPAGNAQIVLGVAGDTTPIIGQYGCRRQYHQSALWPTDTYGSASGWCV